MDVFYGSYRALEEKFDTYVAGLQPGPQRRILVVCPSGRVASYLRNRLVKQQGFISNVFFTNFSQLMSALDQETSSPRLPLLPADSFHDYVLKKLLQTPALNRYPMSRGFVEALKESLLDLADSLADPEVLQEHLLTTTDQMFVNETAHMKWLLEVYHAYQAQMQQIPGFRCYQQYFEDVLAQASHSQWLAGFSQLIFYGFYELTGRQLELFHLLYTHYPTIAFWAYTAQPAFLFGHKFFETNILGAASDAVAVACPTKECAAGPVLPVLFTSQTAVLGPNAIQIMSAPDPEAELFGVVKEILRLHHQCGVAFADMAVTARSLASYQTDVAAVFAQNHIPLQTNLPARLAEKPLGIFLINLLSLLRRGFDREDMIAVVGSPYFNRPNKWRYLIEESLAQRDFAQWMDLVRPGLKNYDPAFLTWLEEVQRQLAFLETPASWENLCEAVIHFLTENTRTDILDTQEKQCWEQVIERINGLKRYQTVAPRAQEREFIEEVLTAVGSLAVYQVSDMAAGVTVADVSSLRGLGFNVVFILGMNEKSFPQAVQEDPILKDYYRRVLRDQLGFWLNQKMERLEEERLLFATTLEMARKHLYMSFSRADGQGKPLILSSYLIELIRAAGWQEDKLTAYTISKQLSARLKQIDFTYLTAKEVSLLLATQDAGIAAYEQARLANEQLQHSLQAAQGISNGKELGYYDGMIVSGNAVFSKQNTQGFSPSALQDLARCPMKYFLAKGLGLQEPDEVLSRAAMAPNLRGSAYHQILMTYYQQLYKEGLHNQLFASACESRLQQAVAVHYNEQSYKSFGIYPVIWQLILQDIQNKLTAFVCKEAEELGNYIPTIFETYFEKEYTPTAGLRIKLKGIIDRIDVDAQHKTFRIIDYKSGRHGGKNLAEEMFKHVILQPFIYLILAQGEKQTAGLKADGAALLNINKGYARQELSQAGFEAVAQRAADFFTLLMQLIKQGQFFISPGEHCAYCPYGAVCRRDCYHTLLRARRSRIAQRLEEAKQ